MAVDIEDVGSDAIVLGTPPSHDGVDDWFGIFLSYDGE